jgi:RNA polymerase sigma-70 factor (ECF subfamily)
VALLYDSHLAAGGERSRGAAVLGNMQLAGQTRTAMSARRFRQLGLYTAYAHTRWYPHTAARTPTLYSDAGPRFLARGRPGAMAPPRPLREPNRTIGKEKAMNSLSDAEVIRRSLGEPEAFGLVYDRHAATLLRFLGRRVGAGVAEGLVGELFRIAFERRKTFDGSRASALPWLYGIGSNLLLKHRRGEARRLHANAQMAVREAPDKRASAAALDARLLFPRVADAIQALPDGEREALLLFAWEDLSYQSVAEALELPIGTVRSRLNRARAHLRELLKPGGKNRERSR